MIAKLWRKLFPESVVYVPSIQPMDFDGSTRESALYPDLVTSQTRAPEIYTAMGVELLRLEAEIHYLPELRGNDDLMAWAVKTRAMILAANVLKGRMRLPVKAAAWLNAKKAEQEKQDEEKGPDYTNFGDGF
jgi:hypothetical protein